MYTYIAYTLHTARPHIILLCMTLTCFYIAEKSMTRFAQHYWCLRFTLLNKCNLYWETSINRDKLKESKQKLLDFHF